MISADFVDVNLVERFGDHWRAIFLANAYPAPEFPSEAIAGNHYRIGLPAATRSLSPPTAKLVFDDEEKEEKKKPFPQTKTDDDVPDTRKSLSEV